jgi:hypothetical protein
VASDWPLFVVGGEAGCLAFRFGWFVILCFLPFSHFASEGHFYFFVLVLL